MLSLYNYKTNNSSKKIKGGMNPMKKFISMVMTAAMVASLVPATAFAKATDYGVKASASVVGPWAKNEKAFDGKVTGADVPELQLKVTEEGRYNTTGVIPEVKVEVRLDNAEFVGSAADLVKGVSAYKDGVDLIASGSSVLPIATGYQYDRLDDAALKELMNQYYYQGNTSLTDIRKGVANSNLGKQNTQQGTALTNSDWETGGFNKPKTKEDYIMADFRTNASRWGITSAANYDLTAGGFAKKTSVVDAGPAVISEADFTIVTGRAFDDYKDEALDPWWAANKGEFNTNVADVAKETELKTQPLGTKVQIINASLNDDKDVFEFTVKAFLPKDTIIGVDLTSKMDKTGRDALVSVTSDMVNANDMTYVKVADKGIVASIQKVEKVAVDEVKELHNSGITIKETVDNSYKVGDEVTLRLNNGFEFVEKEIKVGNGTSTVAVTPDYDGNVAKFVIKHGMMDGNNEMTIYGLEVEATSAKVGAKATVEIKIADLDKVKVEVLEVVDYKVVMSVDKDKEVPVYYSGVDAKDTGLTSNEDHESLEITIEETFPGAWSSRKGFNITVPDGVYVTDVRVKDVENFQKGRDSREVFNAADWTKAFEKAYQNGDHKNFEFDKRVFNDVDTQLQKKAASMTFVLTLVADYEFEGDVKIGLEGETIGKVDPVVVAKFEKPYTVEAEQNDLKIDARQTKLDKNIVVKETADGLWDKNTEFVLGIEKDLIAFEDGAKFEVSKDSGLEIKDHFVKDTKDTRAHISFDVKSVGDKKADVTISNMSLFMERNIPQGEYGLELTGTLRDAYVRQTLFAPDDAKVAAGTAKYGDKDLKDDNFVDDVTDSSKTVNKKFINVITARRDEDGFTTRIAVPVGETYIFAGVDKLEGAENSMEVPAYINKDNYTMLPLRAVARALGIANGNIYWNQATQTATVQYGNSRIMTFKLGAKEMIINGHSMPAVAGIEMTNNRLFLSLRDLGVAMNVPAEKIAWDSKTKTAYLNPTEEDMAAIKG